MAFPERSTQLTIRVRNYMNDDVIRRDHQPLIKFSKGFVVQNDLSASSFSTLRL